MLVKTPTRAVLHRLLVKTPTRAVLDCLLVKTPTGAVLDCLLVKTPTRAEDHVVCENTNHGNETQPAERVEQ